MFDFHNHLIPGVDDGAESLDESRAALQIFEQQGVTGIITTPHFQASTATRPAELARFLDLIYEKWIPLKETATAEFPDLTLERGVEVALDIPNPILDNPLLRLAGTSFALVEFPHMAIPPNSVIAIRELVRQGVNPVIAHPERYSGMAGNPDLMESWRDAGACIQVNSGSLLGYYGAGPKQLAWSILGAGWAHFLSSDYHARGKCPVAGAADALSTQGATAQLTALTMTNPQLLLANQRPLDVAPIARNETSVWKRFMSWR